MAKSKSMLVWIVGGGIAAALLYEFVFKSKVPPGYVRVDVAPGAGVHFPTGSVQDVARQIAFVLPSGAHWTGAGEQLGASISNIALPPNPTDPLLVAGIEPGTQILLGFTDGVGNAQLAGYVFA